MSERDYDFEYRLDNDAEDELLEALEGQEDDEFSPLDFRNNEDQYGGDFVGELEAELFAEADAELEAEALAEAEAMTEEEFQKIVAELQGEDRKTALIDVSNFLVGAEK